MFEVSYLNWLYLLQSAFPCFFLQERSLSSHFTNQANRFRSTHLSWYLAGTKPLASRPLSLKPLPPKKTSGCHIRWKNKCKPQHRGNSFNCLVTAVSHVERASPNPDIQQTWIRPASAEVLMEMWKVSPSLPDSSHPMLLQPQTKKKKGGPKLLFQKGIGGLVTLFYSSLKPGKSFSFFLSELLLLESF